MPPFLSGDPEVNTLIEREAQRLQDTIDLIAAENHPPYSMLAAQGSPFAVKAAEGYPGHRYHAACENADALEQLARDSSVFPGCQGTPSMNAVAAKAVCFQQAASPDYRGLQHVRPWQTPAAWRRSLQVAGSASSSVRIGDIFDNKVTAFRIARGTGACHIS